MNPLLFRAFRALETKVHELNYLFWECTTRCNLACRHCGSDCFKSSKDKDMPLEDFLKALDTIPKDYLKKLRSAKYKDGKQSPFVVILTGGEPLLRPDIEDIGKAITERGLAWSMVSNGFFYNADMHRRLIGAGMKALTISLDGLENEHNWMRGNPNSYRNAIDAIAIAAKEKRLDFDVVSCINKLNIKQLEQMHTILSGLGVKQWRLFTIIPIGRAAAEPLFHLESAETKQLMEFIQEKREAAERLKNNSLQAQSMEVTFSCEGYLAGYEQKVRPAPHFCRAGINIGSILIDGTICACPNVDREVFGQGNIYRDNFYKVWESKFEPFRNRNWARRGECSHCKQFKNCLGEGMHNWHDSCQAPLNCHYNKLIDG